MVGMIEIIWLVLWYMDPSGVNWEWVYNSQFIKVNIILNPPEEKINIFSNGLVAFHASITNFDINTDIYHSTSEIYNSIQVFTFLPVQWKFPLSI